MLEDLGKGTKYYGRTERILIIPTVVGWLGSIFSGLTGLLPMWPFAIYAIVGSSWLMVKAMTNYLNNFEEFQ